MADLAGDIIRLNRRQIPAAAAMLTRAFYDDPKLVHLMPDRPVKDAVARHLFAFELRYGLNYGDVYTTSPSVEGVAVWLPSNTSEVTLWRAFCSGGFRLQRELGRDIMDHLMAFSTYIDELHKVHAPFPHTYLFFIGVDPAHQGTGFASRLVRPMLGWLDSRKHPCYLNTQNAKNISLYEHFGFRVIDQRNIPGSRIIHTAMLRDPAR